MLVLTRKPSQIIQIGDNVVIKVIRTSNGSVKIGIDAPNDVRIMRGELDEELSKLYDAPVAPKKKPLENSRLLQETLTTTEAPPSDCRPGELIDEEEPISLADYLSQKTVLA